MLLDFSNYFKLGTGGLGTGDWGLGIGNNFLPITNYPLPITNYPIPYLTLNLLAVANKSCAIPVKLWKTWAIS
ncbi:hypothetical protein FJR11_04185 [Anabaena sp. UHCC 0187]|nr:hypothetical protein [Anabaena sp. UHCC 0187]